MSDAFFIDFAHAKRGRGELLARLDELKAVQASSRSGGRDQSLAELAVGFGLITPEKYQELATFEAASGSIEDAPAPATMAATATAPPATLDPRPAPSRLVPSEPPDSPPPRAGQTTVPAPSGSPAPVAPSSSTLPRPMDALALIAGIRKRGLLGPAALAAAEAHGELRLGYVQSSDVDPGKYLVLDWLAVGGMGAVVKGYDTALARFVAIKLVPAEAKPQFFASLRQESIALGRLNHPNVVRVFDCDTTPGAAYLVMELVEGKSLDRRLADDGPCSESEGWRVLSDVTDAMAHAEKQGVFHYDLKPGNILYDEPSSSYKVCDFGLAGLMVGEDEVFATDKRFASLPYMSPEQLQRAPLDARSDMYSLGITVFHLVTRQLPFADAKARIRTDVPDVRTVRPDLSSQFAHFLTSITSRDREGRPGTWAAFRVFLDRSRTVTRPASAARVLRPSGVRKAVPNVALEPARGGEETPSSRVAAAERGRARRGGTGTQSRKAQLVGLLVALTAAGAIVAILSTRTRPDEGSGDGRTPPSSSAPPPPRTQPPPPPPPRETERWRPIFERARTAELAGQAEAGLSALDEAENAGAPGELAEPLRARLKSLRAEQKEWARISARVDSFVASGSVPELDGAMKELDRAERLAERAGREAERQAAVERVKDARKGVLDKLAKILADAYAALDAHNFDGATELGEKARALAPDSVDVLAFLKRLDQGLLERDRRKPVPAAADLIEAEKTVKEVFKAEYARTNTADRQALAQKLLEQAHETRDDIRAVYVLLREARDLSIQGKDPATTVIAVAEMGRVFEIDALGEEAAALLKCDLTKAPETAKELADACLAVAADAVDGDRYDTALSLLERAEKAAQIVKTPGFVEQVKARRADAQEMQRDAAGVADARRTLAQNPDDLHASTIVGRFLCLVKGDFERGLPLLAKGDDAQLRALAASELSAPADGSTLTTNGDGWWDVAERTKGAQQVRARERAVMWYRKALPEATGLTKAKLEHRIDTFEKSQAERPPPVQKPGATTKTESGVVNYDDFLDGYGRLGKGLTEVQAEKARLDYLRKYDGRTARYIAELVQASNASSDPSVPKLQVELRNERHAFNGYVTVKAEVDKISKTPKGSTITVEGRLSTLGTNGAAGQSPLLLWDSHFKVAPKREK